MASIHIDKDLAQAVKDGRMTHPQAWEANTLRKAVKRLDGKIETLNDKLDPLLDERDAAQGKLRELEDLLGPVAVEPKSDE